MSKLVVGLILFPFVLASCAPVPEQASVTTSTTSSPLAITQTIAPSPTFLPTASPTAIPVIQVGNQTAPDPRFSNPELFNLNDPEAPIPLFVNALKMTGIEVDGDEISQSLEQPESFRLAENGDIELVYELKQEGVR